jgi:O-antigen/teichoic acid export membrane protein
MSRTSRVLASVSLGYVQLALSTFFGLWFVPFLLRRVGQNDFGLWAGGMPILMYVGLVDFGVLTIFQRDVAFALGKANGDPLKMALPDAMGATRRLVLLQMPVLLVGVAIVWLCLPADWSALRIPLAIALGCLVLTFPLRIYHALLTGLQDLRFLGIVALATWALGALTSVVFVALGWRLNALAISWAMSQIATYAACLLRVRARFPAAMSSGARGLSWADASTRLRKGFWVLVSQLAVMMAGGTDLLVIAAVLGPSAVTPYSITDKLVTMANNLPLLVLAAAQPALSELRTSTPAHRLGSVVTALTRVVLLAGGLIATVVVVVNQGFVVWWIGPHEFGGHTLVLLLVADMLLGHYAAATAYTLFSFGYERLISITSVVGGALLVGATFVLTRHVGTVGAPLASIAARGLVSLPVLLLATARATGGTFLSVILPVFSWLWRIGLLIAAASLATRSWMPRTIVELAGAGAAATVVYALVMSPLALSEPLGRYTRPRFAALRQRLARSA